MAQQSPDYKQLLHEAEKTLLEIQQGRLKEQQEAQEIDRHEELFRKTTLPEFLDACHTNLQMALKVQIDYPRSFNRSPANLNNKLRPDCIKAWDEFPVQLETIWSEIMASEFATQRNFTQIIILEERKEEIEKKPIMSQQDLSHFLASNVKGHLLRIIDHLYNDPELRECFHLKDSINFDHHTDCWVSALPPESKQKTNLSGDQRRRSARIQTQSNGTQSSDSFSPAKFVTTSTAEPDFINGWGADQYCLYNVSSSQDTTEQQRAAVLLLEYKSPQKLQLGYINEGLHDMKLEQVVQHRKTDKRKDYCRRLLAAAITQAFSYMMRAGLEYGCICTGEAYIFLRIPEDPRLVYYYLSVPKGDVGEKTGWTPDASTYNRLHLTALGQMLAFTLLAMKTRPREQQWRNKAATELNRWDFVYESFVDHLLNFNIPLSEYRPPRRKEYLHMSPVQLRLRSTLCDPSGSQPPEDLKPHNDDKPISDIESGQPQLQSAPQSQDTAIQLSDSGSDGNSHDISNRQYCTQTCLRGLRDGGYLDKLCPNARDHGDSHHKISKSSFMKLMRQQLANSLDFNCENLDIYGARGVLFKACLTSHGYTVVAKATMRVNVRHLRHEAAVYNRLLPIQGIYVPVHLGGINLASPYHYDGITTLVHMMFLSFSGVPVRQHVSPGNQTTVIQQIQRSLYAIHTLGVLHRDLRLRNILWDAGQDQAMLIDFERSHLRREKKKGLRSQPTTTLTELPLNRKRKEAEGEATADDDNMEDLQIRHSPDLNNPFVRELDWTRTCFEVKRYYGT